MKPSQKSIKRLGITQSKATMYEYNVDEKYHIDIQDHPSELFPLTIGILGDSAATISDENNTSDDESLLKHLQFSARFFDAYITRTMDKES